MEDAGRKQQDVQDEMEKTLQQMEEVLGMSTEEHSPLCPSLKCDSAVVFSLWTVWYPVCGCCSLAQSVVVPLGVIAAFYSRSLIIANGRKEYIFCNNLNILN